ncbi:MAG: DUF2807 domain-containing protein [Bacteroidales bacterium]|nr:DUF2807 domain-containing protein [Bacteroidales bacterium]
MKRILITFAVALAVVATASCKDNSSVKLTGKDATNTYTFNNALGLSVSSGIEVELIPNNELVTTIIEVTADEAILPYLNVNEKDGMLTLTTHPFNASCKKLEIRARVTGPALPRYLISASAEVKCAKQIQATDIEFTCASSADFDLTDVVATGSITVNAASSADFECKVLQAQTINLNAASSADIEVTKVLANILIANAASSGDIETKITKAVTISANAASSGDIDLKGIEATDVAANATTGGDISLAGTAASLNKATSNGGEIHARALTTAQ